MGTNYYVEISPEETCKCCGHTKEAEVLHIGKSSAGWCFALHVIPEKGLDSLEKWLSFLSGKKISDGYGNSLTRLQLDDIITERRYHKELTPETSTCEKGPNNLLRSRIDGLHCVGHGNGTWDLIVGEFS